MRRSCCPHASCPAVRRVLLRVGLFALLGNLATAGAQSLDAGGAPGPSATAASIEPSEQQNNASTEAANEVHGPDTTVAESPSELDQALMVTKPADSGMVPKTAADPPVGSVIMTIPPIHPPQTLPPQAATHPRAIWTESTCAPWSCTLGLAPTPAARLQRKDRIDSPASRPTEPSASRLLGVMLDVGIPDGVMAGVSLRPWSFFRAHAAVGTNAIALGVRGGLTLRLPTTISPALVVEAGQYFEGNANRVTGQVVGSSYRDSRMAEAVGYRFANLHLGLELGNERSTFLIHGGMSYIRADLHNTNDALSGGDSSSDHSITINVSDDPRLTAWVPSIKLGFLLYLV